MYYYTLIHCIHTVTLLNVSALKGATLREYDTHILFTLLKKTIGTPWGWLLEGWNM